MLDTYSFTPSRTGYEIAPHLKPPTTTNYPPPFFSCQQSGVFYSKLLFLSLKNVNKEGI